MDNAAVGNRLFELRTSLKLSQSDFANSIGVSATSYQGYEKGDREVPASLLEHLFDQYHIEPLWIIKAGDSNKNYPKYGFLGNISVLKEIFLAIEDAEKHAGSKTPFEGKFNFALVVYRRFLADGDLDSELISTWVASGARESV